MAINALWPKRIISTAALQMISDSMIGKGRSPEIMADAAYLILEKPKSFSGNFCIDEDLLMDAGIRDFSKYEKEEAPLDFFIEEGYHWPPHSKL